ncbi:MAG: succinate dehydrogenase, cytochrome b556 subunit [Aquimonas sp.]|nr:succinate dehydrogenase, cytochrome b556 subunit [Aquimonas sp.]
MSTRKRPLSPHLQVYRPQITSVLSISHRIAGIVNAVVALGVAGLLVSVAAGPEAYARFAAVAGSVPGLVVLFLFTLSICYHLFNGVRHLVWDTGAGFDIPKVYASGYAVIALAVASAVGIWAVVLGGAA